MGGIFSKANRPKLPGAYVNFEPAIITLPPVNPGSIVALTFTHDWGPANEVVRVRDFAAWKNVYGESDDTPGYRAAKQCYTGEAYNGRGGAGEVLAYRQAGASAAEAFLTLNNTTPAPAVTLTAVYPGSRGNDLRVEVLDQIIGAPEEATDILVLYDGTVELERYEYTDTDIQELVDKINLESEWVTAALLIDGVALTKVSATALASGDDGETLIISDYTDAWDKLEVEAFGVYSSAQFPDFATDPSFHVSLKEWLQDLNTHGKRMMTVIGGPAGEALTQAISRTENYKDPNVINLGYGEITDHTLGPGSTPIDLSTQQVSPRIAGIVAARGEGSSITHARLTGTSLKQGPTLEEQLLAFDQGVAVFARDSHLDSPVHLKVGLTTWTKVEARLDPERPYLLFRQPKYVRTMHGIERDLTKWAEEQIIGTVPVNDKTREAIIGETKRQLREREKIGALQPGWAVTVDQTPPPSDDDEFVAILIACKFARSLEQIYWTVVIS